MQSKYELLHKSKGYKDGCQKESRDSGQTDYKKLAKTEWNNKNIFGFYAH